MVEKDPSIPSITPSDKALSKDEIYELLNNARFPDGANDYPSRNDDGSHGWSYDIYNKENEEWSINFDQIPLTSEYVKSIWLIAQLQNISYTDEHPLQILEKILNGVSGEDIVAIEQTCNEWIAVLQNFISEKKPDHIASCVRILTELIAQNQDNQQVINPLMEKKAYLQKLTNEYVQKQIDLLQEINTYIQTYKELVDVMISHATGENKNELLALQSWMKWPATTEKNDKIVQIVKDITTYEWLESWAVPYGTFNQIGSSLPEEIEKMGQALGRGKGSQEITELGRIQDAYLSEQNDHRKLQLYKDANKKLEDILIFLTATENKLSDEDISKIAQEVPVAEFLKLPVSEKYPAKTQFLLIRIYESMVRQATSNAIAGLDTKSGLLKMFSRVNIPEQTKQLETDRDATLALLETKKDELNKVITRFNAYKADDSLYRMYAEFGLKMVA